MCLNYSRYYNVDHDSGLSLNEYSLDNVRSFLNKNLVNSAALDSDNSGFTIGI